MVLAQLAFLVLFIHLVIRPLMAAYFFTRPPRLRVTFRTPADWGADYQDVKFPGAGGMMLEGWYVPPRNGAAVVLVHGHSGNRLAVAYHAEVLTRAGFGVLMFDLRAHGSSGGRLFVRGVEAVDDVVAAAAFLSRQPEVRQGIGMMGVSVGAMLAIQAAARNVTIRAVAADGPVLGTVDDLPPPAGVLDRFWRYPLERYYQAAIDWISRSTRPPANTAALARLARRPILLISTGRGLERRLTRLLYDAAAQPKQLWEIPEAGHANGWRAEPLAYGQKIVAFFGRALAVDGYTAEDSSDAPPDEGETETLVGEGGRRPARQPDMFHPVAERTIAPATAMMLAFAMIPLAMILFIIPFQLRWNAFAPRLPDGRGLLVLLGLLAGLMAGLLLHEIVHLIGYRLLGRVAPGVATLNFGRAALAPQIRCDQPVPAGIYRRILLLPGVALGVVPGLVAIAIGSWVLLIWAVWMMVAAGGDVAGLWAMRGVPAGTPVRGHPTRVGCQLFAPLESLQNLDE